MIICSGCNKKNTLDNQFCSGCGIQLNQKALAALNEKYNQYIADGYQLLKQDRSDEAMLIAQVCIKANENSRHSWSLLGDCYQKNGNLNEALDCYEKAVNKDPESNLEQIKIEYFKNIKNQPQVLPNPQKKPIMWGLITTATCLVIGIMNLLYKENQIEQPILTKAEAFNIQPQTTKQEIEHVQTPAQPIALLQPPTPPPTYRRKPVYKPQRAQTESILNIDHQEESVAPIQPSVQELKIIRKPKKIKKAHTPRKKEIKQENKPVEQKLTKETPKPAPKTKPGVIDIKLSEETPEENTYDS